MREAKDALSAAVDACQGHPHLPSDEERAAAKPSCYVWPCPKKRWRIVVVRQRQVLGEWETYSVSCDCGRKGGTGRDCAHVFRVLDVVQCHTYKIEWVHHHWRPSTALDPQPTTTAARPSVTRPRAASSQPRPALPCVSAAEEASALRELHEGTARGYGHSLLDATYRGTSGPADPLTIRRMEAAAKVLKWIHETSGDVLVKVECMSM